MPVLPADSKTYFCSPELDLKKVVQNLYSKIEQQNQFNRDSGVVRRAWKTYRQYYGLTRDGLFNSSEVGNGGEAGEYAMLKVNRLRQLAQSMMSRVIGQPPAVTPVASNSDYKSVIETKDAQALADHYARKKKIPSLEIERAENALIFGWAALAFGWNQFGGPEIGLGLSETGDVKVETAGELTARMYAGLDVIVDYSRRDSNHEWVILRDWLNKYDIAAEHGKQLDPDTGEVVDITDKIVSLQPPRDFFDFRSALFGAQSAESRVPYENSDQIPVYTFYHKRTPAMPDGAEITFLSADIPLTNQGQLTFREIPVEVLMPAKLMGTPWGYSPLWDLLALQEAIDAYNSIRLTNYKTFGVGCIAMPDQYETNIYDIANGLAVIPYNQQMGKPEALNLAASPPGMDAAEEMLIKAMETLAGSNGVLTGSDPAHLSGSAMALLDAKTNEFHGLFSNNVKDATEGDYTKMLHILQDRLTEPEDVAIGGQMSGATKQIGGTDIKGVDRFAVESSNPLSKTQSGRYAMAQDLLAQRDANGKPLISADEYIEIIKTGERDPLMESEFKQVELIKAENETLMRGQCPPVYEHDQHMDHLREHPVVVSSPQVRMDPQQLVLKALTEHQTRHACTVLNLPNPPPDWAMQQIHDLIMTAMGQPVIHAIPPPPPGMPPPGPPGPPPPGAHPPGPPMHGPAPHGPPPKGQSPQHIVGPPPPQGPGMPRMPVNPATGERAPA